MGKCPYHTVTQSEYFWQTKRSLFYFVEGRLRLAFLHRNTKYWFQKLQACSISASMNFVDDVVHTAAALMTAHWGFPNREWSSPLMCPNTWWSPTSRSSTIAALLWPMEPVTKVPCSLVDKVCALPEGWVSTSVILYFLDSSKVNPRTIQGCGHPLATTLTTCLVKTLNFGNHSNKFVLHCLIGRCATVIATPTTTITTTTTTTYLLCKPNSSTFSAKFPSISLPWQPGSVVVQFDWDHSIARPRNPQMSRPWVPWYLRLRISVTIQDRRTVLIDRCISTPPMASPMVTSPMTSGKRSNCDHKMFGVPYRNKRAR